MSKILYDHLRKQHFQVIEEALESARGKESSCVTSAGQYRQKVVQRAWFGLPLPIRLLGRHDLRWDEYFSALQEKAFDLSSGFVALQADYSLTVAGLARRFFLDEEEQPPAPQAAPEANRPPLAPGGGPGAGGDIAVGIDLGTTYSLIASVDAQGRPVCLTNAAGERLTPSVVLFGDEGTIIGKEAVLAAALEPERVAECVKRDMGAKVFRKKIKNEYLPPEVISSFILKSLKTDAERQLGPVRRAVITVPAYFEETRRRATMDAGKLAGLEVIDIINEPTAAAIAYGYKVGFLDRQARSTSERPLRVLVFDLGGGTFDVTIVEIQGTSFQALATDGDVYLGGKDWDQKLLDIAAERFRQQHGQDPRLQPSSLQELWQATEAAKRTLTERSKASLFVNCAGQRLKVEVTKQEFEEATAGLLERTRMTTEIVVRQAGLEWRDIDRVLLVGGSTRMPMVINMLQELTGKPPDRSLSPDEAVAQGAALYAELLAPRLRAADDAPAQAPFTVTNVSSHSLGILGKDLKTGLRTNKILLPKNSPLPLTVTKTFKTSRPNQRQVVIKVMEGESAQPNACTQIGVCSIRPLPRNLPVGWPVEVSYTYEANGRLQVTAQVKGHAAVTTHFTRENSMGDEDLDLWAKYVGEEMSRLS